MSGEPDVPSYQPCDDRRDRGKVDSIQEVIRLFDETHAPLRRFLIFLELTPEDADDCLQEAFLRLHKHIASLTDLTNGVGCFRWRRNWREISARARGRTEHQPRAGNTNDSRGPSPPKDTPEASLLKQERLEWFRSALARRTPQQVECLQLRIAGLRYREIAAVWGAFPAWVNWCTGQ
jgi:RNA polymerase sigma-70 factor (ECF subfamily)